MSYSRSKNTKSQGTKTPFCKICCDLGKPKSVYTSHYVRKTPHPDSMITCHVLLANVCRNCNMTGHFTGSCPKAKREERERRKERFAEERQRKKYAEQSKKTSESSRQVSKNAFVAIYEDSDNDDEVVQCVVVESRPIVKRKKILNWADMDSDSDYLLNNYIRCNGKINSSYTSSNDGVRNRPSPSLNLAKIKTDNDFITHLLGAKSYHLIPFL